MAANAEVINLVEDDGPVVVDLDDRIALAHSSGRPVPRGLVFVTLRSRIVCNIEKMAEQVLNERQETKRRLRDVAHSAAQMDKAQFRVRMKAEWLKLMGQVYSKIKEDLKHLKGMHEKEMYDRYDEYTIEFEKHILDRAEQREKRACSAKKEYENLCRDLEELINLQ